jgi:hypothetical protein
MSLSPDEDPTLKINLETAQIAWKDLQRWFASGATLAVHTELDLLTVARAMESDDTAQVRAWLEAQQLGPVSDAQALDWFTHDHQVWAVVVKPWVLVQATNKKNNAAPANNQH